MLQTHKWADRKMKLNTYWQTKGSKKEAKCINLLLEINLYEKISGYKFWLIIITYNQCTSYERKDFTIVSIFQPFFAITSSSRHYCIVVFPFAINNTVLQSNHIDINIFFLCIFIFWK